MAMTATIALNPSSSVYTEQKCTASVTVSNSGSVPITLTSVQGFVLPTGAANSSYNTGVSVSPVNVTGPNTSVVVQGSGTQVVTFDVKFHAPSNNYLGTGSGTYSVSALCYSDDGSVFSPTAATITVNYVVSYASAQS